MNFLEVADLRKIYNILGKSTIEWYVIGSTNLALQGIEITPSCLGILIPHSYIYDFIDLFSNFRRTEIIDLDNWEAQEFTIFVGNTKVTVCAEYVHGTYWKFKDAEIIELDGMQIPVLSLESEKRAYEALNMPERASLVEKFLQKT